MHKKICLYTNVLLIVWFFLDMSGFSIGKFSLVESAWASMDGIWFLLYIGIFFLFYFKDKAGKYLLTVFLLLWLVIQFLSHWYYTIFGATERKIHGYNNSFADTFHLIPASNKMIIPDLYHSVLHLLILTALICMIMFFINSRKRKILIIHNSST